jgi:hypothetical protein
MRALVLALALLAALKIWVQDSLYRSATEEALVSAYRARAADACAKVAPSAKPVGTPDGAVDWLTAPEGRVAVGNPAVAVHFWQFDHELWNARFRQPYLVLSAGGTSATCTYDILADTAEVSRS